MQSVQQDVPLAGMMTGISEVTIPLEQRLKRIEETEAAKSRMLAAAAKRWVGQCLAELHNQSRLHMVRIEQNEIIYDPECPSQSVHSFTLIHAFHRAHLPMEEEQQPIGNGRMKRNVVPLAFGRSEKGPRVDWDRAELEKQRRRSVTEHRPLVFPKAPKPGK